jgi:hypothetical protein
MFGKFLLVSKGKIAVEEMMREQKQMQRVRNLAISLIFF